MKKIIRCLPFLLLLLLLCGASVQAANYKPGKVTGVTAKNVGETGFTLKWKKVSKATGYYVYRLSGTSWKRIATVKSTSYNVKKMVPNKAYQFKVVAYRTVKKKTYVSDTFSGVLTVTTRVKKPAKPTGFRVGANGNRTLELNWNKASNASGYEVYTYDKSTGYKKVKTLTGKSCKFTGLTVGKKYTYAVRSYRKVSGQTVYSSYSSLVSGTPIQLSKAASAVRSFRYIRKTSKKVTVYNYDKKKNQTLKSGTKVYVNSKTKSGYLNAWIASNGQKIKIKASALKSATSIEFSPKNDYSKSVKEEFINSKNLISPSKYLIWINHYKTRVNIFKGSVNKWKLVKSFKVSIGKVGSPRGIRRVCGRVRWGYENLPIVYWSPGGNSFHSMLGSSTGTATSGGCMRCLTNDLMWIYNNIPDGTTVYSW